jgi:DNA mismatch repair protein MutS2
VVTSFHIHESYSPVLQELRKKKQAIEFKIIREREEEAKKELRAQRALVIEQEQEEEYKVRVFLSEKLRKDLAMLEHNITAISQLELICAKAQMAIEHEGVRPKIDSHKQIVLKQGINPELAAHLKESSKTFTPVDMELKEGCTLLTGANMGGKTVALNTLISNVELALMGFYVFAKKLQMPLLDFVFMTGNEANSHGFGLSSFGAEIVKLNELIELNQKGRGLVVCDEFARSTNPDEGKRFVQALTDFFNHHHSFGLLSTHYDGIKNQGLCYRVRGLKKDIKNISLMAESIENHMDYRLIQVSNQETVPKEAINIAKLMNLSTDFLKILEKYYKI